MHNEISSGPVQRREISSNASALPHAIRLATRPGRRLLVVDDCHDHLEALSAALGELGHEVRVAHNGELALAQLHEFEPHGVLLDVHMPVMNGYELAQCMRTYLQRQTVLIGMSGAAPTDPAVAGIAALLDGWVSKPIDLRTLERCLENLLGPGAALDGEHGRSAPR